MKTKILKWDVALQSFMVLFNLLFTIIPLLWFVLLLLQLLEGAYQLLSSSVHLLISHKSVGFKKYRQLHLFGSILYLIFLFALIKFNVLLHFESEVVQIVCGVIIPQAIFYAYFRLCKRELNYLERREFFILK